MLSHAAHNKNPHTDATTRAARTHVSRTGFDWGEELEKRICESGGMLNELGIGAALFKDSDDGRPLGAEERVAIPQAKFREVENEMTLLGRTSVLEERKNNIWRRLHRYLNI